MKQNIGYDRTVLSAMNIADEQIGSAIRISWDADIDLDKLMSDFSNMLETIHTFQIS